MRILVVEDNRDIAANLGDYLEERGHTVDYAADGVTGLHLAVVNDFDAIVLDLNLPGMDGLEVCRKLRAEGRKQTPVLMLTARDSLDSKLSGFESGADDYLVKPFAVGELLARMRALGRRRVGAVAPVLGNGVLALDPVSKSVMLSGTRHALSNREFALLRELLVRPGAVLSRADLEDRIYGWGEEVIIHSLRKKLGPESIRNVRGLGWMVERAAQAAQDTR